jgi:hypothetical protein
MPFAAFIHQASAERLVQVFTSRFRGYYAGEVSVAVAGLVVVGIFVVVVAEAGVEAAGGGA